MDEPPATPEAIAAWLREIREALTGEIPNLHAQETSDYGRFARWVVTVQPELEDLALESHQYVQKCLTTAVDCLSAIAYTVEENLPHAEFVLIRVVHEGSGLALWLTEPALSFRERLGRFLRCTGAENKHWTRMLSDLRAAGKDVSGLMASAEKKDQTLARFRAELKLPGGVNIPDESDLIDLIPSNNAWERTIMSSLIHSRSFAADIVEQASREDPQYRTDFAINAGAAFIDAFESLASFVMGPALSDSSVAGTLSRLRNQ